MKLTNKENIFGAVKALPSIDVLMAFLPGTEIRHKKISSPFSEDRKPSFHIYPNGFKDFSTGAYYDNVAFVAALLNIRRLEAAKRICGHFGITTNESPLSIQDKLQLDQVKAEREREKLLREAFENWTRWAGQQVRILAEAIRLQLEVKGLEIDDDLLPLVHDLPCLEWWADILTEGSTEEIVELYKDSDFRRWFPCWS